MPSPNLSHDNYGNVLQQSYDEKTFRGEYDVSNNLIYAGFALPGADTSVRVWQLKKLTYDGSNNLLTIVWPEYNNQATIEYNFAWDDRASYTYS